MTCGGGAACPLAPRRVADSTAGFSVACLRCGIRASLPWVQLLPSEEVDVVRLGRDGEPGSNRWLLDASEIVDWVIVGHGLACPRCATLSMTSEGTENA